MHHLYLLFVDSQLHIKKLKLFRIKKYVKIKFNRLILRKPPIRDTLVHFRSVYYPNPNPLYLIVSGSREQLANVLKRCLSSITALSRA